MEANKRKELSLLVRGSCKHRADIKAVSSLKSFFFLRDTHEITLRLNV